MASNATEGHIWQEFSSDTYKHLPTVHVTDLVYPLATSLNRFPSVHGRPRVLSNTDFGKRMGDSSIFA